ncbi:hypothetical protein ONS95_004739 [Cadophora gregata]|uniref:uncharacterized protein n=1 Tax=Cadophora gregata TaxID=51156 RepID=UPI0026DD7C6B|nr:uncharacterized protein ONS95_004739 [Cadophora gregata]KAK0104450.1 hypothetical protein ONS95_004739 [Cadophora gregata]KAK0115457.1 hypothetical protein ONS96_013913 [Cadophora gregata f. sp. sojae]
MLCDDHKEKQDSLQKGYNYVECGDLKEIDVDVDALDNEHVCQARLTARGGSEWTSESVVEEEEEVKEPEIANEKKKGGCVGM